MIRLGSLAGYPFEGPRVLGGWTPPARPAVYAVMYKPEAGRERYAVMYVGHSDDLSTEQFPFNHPGAPCWIKRAGARRLAVVHDGTSFPVTLAQSTVDAAKRAGITPISLPALSQGSALSGRLASA